MSSPLDSDDILKEIGQFGRFQISTLLLLSFPIIYCGVYDVSFIFTAANLPYRCLVPECESNLTYTSPEAPEWLKGAMPPLPARVSYSCTRYLINDTQCRPESFDSSSLIECSQPDQIVFLTDEVTIVKDYNLVCDEKQWHRTLVGSLNNFGSLVGMPLAGHFADRFGRRKSLVVTAVVSSILGIVKSFCTNYMSFIILETVGQFFGSGMYCMAFTLGVELVGPDKRLLATIIISSMFCVGEIVVALVAWYAQDWRLFLRLLFIPGLLFFVYQSVLPESLRWYLATHKYKSALKSALKIAKANGTKLSIATQNKIVQLHSGLVDNLKQDPLDEPATSMCAFCTSPKITIRFIIVNVVWSTSTFVFYGIALNAVEISGNKYLNFGLVSFAEAPAYLLTYFIVDWLGRRNSLVLTLVGNGLSCIGFMCIPEGNWIWRLVIFLAAKSTITISFTVLYILSAEVFPTTLRISLIGLCSMISRIGAMLAPQTPLLAVYVDPMKIFAGLSIVAGILAAFLPETKNVHLPDTPSQAAKIGSDYDSNQA